MNRRGALKEARRRWGPEAEAHDKGLKRAGTPESRGEALEQLKRLREIVNKQGSPRTPEQREEMDRLTVAAMAYRYEVGQRIGGAWFRIEAWGDSWEQAFASADAKEAQAKVNRAKGKRSRK